MVGGKKPQNRGKPDDKQTRRRETSYVSLKITERQSYHHRNNKKTTMPTITTKLYNIIQSILQSILHSLGLYQKKGTILLLGLDNAGKTTFLHKLRTNETLTTTPPPTQRPNREIFYMENIQFIGWDLGGHEAVRNLWDDYIGAGMMREKVSAVVFMVDAADRERLEEVNDELDALVHGYGHQNDDDDNAGGSNDQGGLKNSGVPLAILLNKCDLETAQSSEVIAEGIGYFDIVDAYGPRHNDYDSDNDDNGDDNESDDNRDGREMVRLFRISAWRGEGYIDAFQWIASFL